MPLRFSPSRGAAAIVLNSIVRGPAGPRGAVGGLYGTRKRLVISSGDIIVSATTDDRVNVKKIVEAATNVTLPTVSDRLAADPTYGYPIFIKSEMSNGALYPLTLIRSGSDTIEGQTTYILDGTRQSVWLWPDDTVTPNNWEIR